jgi:hypothetical protein
MLGNPNNRPLPTYSKLKNRGWQIVSRIPTYILREQEAINQCIALVIDHCSPVQNITSLVEGAFRKIIVSVTHTHVAVAQETSKLRQLHNTFS